ncbi:MAG: hypothetical protein LKE85_07415 [Lachnospiraceae bacterium]|nr:hypothetical protein [Lachnospiraceae bacterium]
MEVVVWNPSTRFFTNANNKIGIMQRRKELQMGILYLHQTLSRREFTMEVVVWNPSTRFFTNAFKKLWLNLQVGDLA